MIRLFYCGYPYVADDFPADSLIPIDMRDPEGAARIIRAAIADNEYEKRLPAIREARRRVLHEYNLFAVLAREIALRRDRTPASGAPGAILSRHALRQRNLLGHLRDLADKARVRLIHLARRN